VAWLATNNHQAKPVEGMAVVRLERVKAGGITIVSGHNFARAFNIEMDAIISARNIPSAAVGNGDRDER